MFNNFSKSEVAARTFLWDSARCFFSGIVEFGLKTFSLIIAIRVFSAPKALKSLLASAWFAGYFITPISHALASGIGRFTATQFGSCYMFAIALAIFASAFAHSFPLFLFPIVVATVLFKQSDPLIVDVYGQNYSGEERSSRVAVALMIFATSALIFSPIFGKLLDVDINNYRWELVALSLAAVGSGMSLLRIPSRVPPARTGKSIFSNFSVLFSDKLFAAMSLWWIFMGIANQMTTPLRTEYLTNPVFGMNESNLFVAHACVTVPIVFRILSSPLWGKSFDRWNAVPIKVAINIFLMAGLWLFFHAKTRLPILVASALIGTAYGGGEMMLHLWVTKIVGSEKFSTYMSANVSVVGLVGLFSPFLGYNLLHYFSLRTISCIAATLLLLSALGFLSLHNHTRFSGDRGNDR